MGNRVLKILFFTFALLIVEISIIFTGAAFVQGMKGEGTSNIEGIERAKPGVYEINMKNYKKFFKFSKKENKKYDSFGTLWSNQISLDYKSGLYKINVLDVRGKEVKWSPLQLVEEDLKFEIFDLSDVYISIDLYCSYNGVEKKTNYSNYLSSWGELYSIYVPTNCVTKGGLTNNTYNVDIDYFYFDIVEIKGCIEYYSEA